MILKIALFCCQVTEGSDAGDKESSVSEVHGDVPSRTAAPSQASTMMPTSYDKNTSVTGDGKNKSVGTAMSHWGFFKLLKSSTTLKESTAQ